MLCKHCKKNSVQPPRTVFCSRDCGVNFHRQLLIKKTSKKNKKINESFRKKIKLTKKVKTKHSKLENIPLCCISDASRRTSLFSIFKTCQIEPVTVKLIKKRITGDSFTYKVSSHSIKDVEKAIRHYDELYRASCHRSYYNRIQYLIETRRHMIEYLDDKYKKSKKSATVD